MDPEVPDPSTGDIIGSCRARTRGYARYPILDCKGFSIRVSQPSRISWPLEAIMQQLPLEEADVVPKTLSSGEISRPTITIP